MASRHYSTILVVYNPNSTGKSQQKAEQITRDLQKVLPKTKIRMRTTKHKGHAEAIALRAGLISRHALVISVSGDGGYNEVVNGAMHAQRLGRKISVGLVPAGNANDHYATRHRGDFVKRVASNDEDRVDLLRIHSRRITRYGHSYIGLGITPQASEKLNAKKLNLWAEVKIIASVLIHLKSIKIIVKGETRHYNSLIFSNVGRMSKIIRVPKHKGDDGNMEVSHLHFRNKFKLVSELVHAATLGLDADEQVSSFEFRTTKAISAQVDGEVIKLAGKSAVKVNVVPHAINCIV